MDCFLCIENKKTRKGKTKKYCKTFKTSLQHCCNLVFLQNDEYKN